MEIAFLGEMFIEERDAMINPSWFDDVDDKPDIKNVDYLTQNEITFFENLIRIYLPPFPPDSPEERKKKVNRL